MAVTVTDGRTEGGGFDEVVKGGIGIGGRECVREGEEKRV